MKDKKEKKEKKYKLFSSLTKKENEELLNLLGQAKNEEDILSVGKEKGVMISPQTASALFSKMNGVGELTEADLGLVSGGEWNAMEEDEDNLC